MPRRARIVIPGFPHHITQRGNNRQDVFFTDEDRHLYLALLKQHACESGLSLLGYCLMTTHVHFIAIPSGPDTLSRVLGRTNFKYAQIINRLHGRSGHLWQDRFYSCALDGPHLFQAMVYIELNPVRAKLARLAWDYSWSSARAHADGTDTSGLLDTAAWSGMMDSSMWKRLLTAKADKEFGAALELHLRRGRPLGSDSFISKMESLVGRRLRPLPHGRPRKRKIIK